MSFLDRIRNPAVATAPGTTAPPTATTSPTPPAPGPVETVQASTAPTQQASAPVSTPAPQQPVQAVATPVVVVATPTTTAVATTPQNTGLIFASAPAIPSLITSDEDANEMAALMTAGQATSSVADAILAGDAGGMKLSHPFSTLKKGNWATHKDCPDNIREFMPVGGEGLNYHAVYLGYRLGANIWQGEADAGGGGGAPLASFVVPDMNLAPMIARKLKIDIKREDIDELTRETMTIARAVQFTPKDERNKWFPNGRLSPELQILVWTPDTSFVVLVVPSYTGVAKTMEIIASDVEPGFRGHPMMFSVLNNMTENKNGTEEKKNKTWNNYYANVASATTSNPNNKSSERDKTKAMKLQAAWMDYKSTAIREVQNQMAVFLCGEDFDGLSIPETAKTLAVFKEQVSKMPKRGAKKPAGSTATE
jgi:hypothetical protein